MDKLFEINYYYNKFDKFDKNNILEMYNKIKNGKINVNIDYENLNINCECCKNSYLCINCINCVDCKNCNDCIDCKNCVDCKKCNDCSDCENCRICNYCEECIDCEKCDNCKNCENCDYCVGCNDCCDYSNLYYNNYCNNSDEKFINIYLSNKTKYKELNKIIKIINHEIRKIKPKNLNPFFANISELYKGYKSEKLDVENDDDIIKHIKDFDNFNKFNVEKFNKLIELIIDYSKFLNIYENEYFNNIIYNINYLQLKPYIKVLAKYEIIKYC